MEGSEIVTIAAFFDIDGTLYRNSLMIQHFRKLIKYEVVDPYVWHEHVKHTYKKWEKRYGDFEDYLEELAEIYVESLKGMPKEHIEFITRQVIRLKGDSVYKYTRERIKWHKEQGHKVFFISGSPDFLVSKMAEKYGADEYKGTKYILDENNRFTGELEKMWESDNKQKALDELLDKYDVELDKSYAYGDTNGDLSMFRIVGNPIAINPNKNLFFNIRKEPELLEKVDIVIERKDLVYKVDGNVEVLDLDFE
ncbi:HAD family hydrolase [Dethiothermospora halolimnae]|uniref:HAD family hydrolase n=1 Tax=Dethiothermospora halolimnae TaxID=3114390 RepID=UPI003CCBA15B